MPTFPLMVQLMKRGAEDTQRTPAPPSAVFPRIVQQVNVGLEEEPQIRPPPVDVATLSAMVQLSRVGEEPLSQEMPAPS